MRLDIEPVLVLYYYRCDGTQVVADETRKGEWINATDEWRKRWKHCTATKLGAHASAAPRMEMKVASSPPDNGSLTVSPKGFQLDLVYVRFRVSPTLVLDTLYIVKQKKETAYGTEGPTDLVFPPPSWSHSVSKSGRLEASHDVHVFALDPALYTPRRCPDWSVVR
jgi:hypothetical protein